MFSPGTTFSTTGLKLDVNFGESVRAQAFEVQTESQTVLWRPPFKSRVHSIFPSISNLGFT